MLRETDFPTAEELLKQFEQSITEYFSSNRPSGTMVIPESPKVINGYFDKQIRSIRYNETSNLIEIL